MQQIEQLYLPETMISTFIRFLLSYTTLTNRQLRIAFVTTRPRQVVFIDRTAFPRTMPMEITSPDFVREWPVHGCGLMFKY